MNKIVGTLLVTLVALLVGGFAAAQGITFVGNWFIQVSLDPITDENSSSMGVMPDSYPSLGRSDVLGVSCDDIGSNGVSLILVGSNYISTNTVSVTYRVDSNSPVTAAWRSTDAAVSPRPGAEMQALIDEMLLGSTIAIRYRAYDTTVTYVYPIAQFGEALQKLGCYTGSL